MLIPQVGAAGLECVILIRLGEGDRLVWDCCVVASQERREEREEEE